MAARPGFSAVILPGDRHLITMMDTSIPALTPSLREGVDTLFAEWDKPHSPGCALGIIRDGELIYARGYGMANLEHDIPITPRSVFRIASTSKQFTAACIGLLVEAGDVSLDDNIVKYLPELREIGTPVTVGNLLHHTSGWRDYIELMELRGMGDDDFYTDEEVLELLSRQHKLNFDPGQEFLYSNTGYYLLGVIIQRASGLSLREFAQENIFKPLGMVNTHFHDDHTEIVKGLAQGYMPLEGTGYRICMTNLDLVGDGGLFTTVEDLYLWDQNFYANKLGKGGVNLINLLQTTGTKNNGAVMTYALGLEIKDYKGLRMVSHSGAFVGYRAEMIRFPEARFSVICLANLSIFDPSKLTRRVADLFLADLFQGPVEEFETEQEGLGDIFEDRLADRTGLYWNPEKDLILEISVEEGKLVDKTEGRRVEFEQLSSDRFRSREFSIELRFERQRTNSDWKLYLKEEEDEPVPLTHFQAVELTPQQLMDYAGSFYSQELDMAYQVVLDDGWLYLKHRNAPKSALRSARTDVFWVADRVLRFKRDARGAAEGPITGFKLNRGRVKDILFQKVS